MKLKLGTKILGDKLIFEFRVKDRTNSSARFFNITERSKGFQWFFNFTIKLKYNHKYKKDRESAIYLLDEPGSYLHTSAQEELLKKLNDISQTNSILYCTHSQFLLNPDIVNVGKIIIAKKEEGKISAIPFKSSGLSEEEGAFAPLFKALHARIPYIDNANSFQVITEGIVEYYFLNLVQKYATFISKDISLIPGSGATQLGVLISYAIAFTEGYRVLLDSDEESRNAFEDYKEKFGFEEAKKFFKYTFSGKTENVIFEDHFSDDDTKKLLRITKAADTKTAIVALFFSTENIIKDFISNLDATTLKRFSPLFGVLSGLKK